MKTSPWLLLLAWRAAFSALTRRRISGFRIGVVLFAMYKLAPYLRRPGGNGRKERAGVAAGAPR